MGIFSAIAGIFGGNKQSKAAKQAAQLQYDAAMAGLNEERRQFDITRADYQPYQDLGKSAINPLGNLVGVNGEAAQQGIIDQLKAGPLYTSLIDSGEEALLANASATGGLRGGNTQDALARFRGDTLNSVIADQLAQYSGLVGIGSGATDAVSNFGAAAVARQNALRNQGAGALAQAKLVQGGIAARNWANFGNTLDDALAAILGGGASPQARLASSAASTIKANPSIF